MSLKMSLKSKMKHVLQYKESCVISEISNIAIISLNLWKHLQEVCCFLFYSFLQYLSTSFNQFFHHTIFKHLLNF